MKYEPISSNDDRSAIKKKLKVFGYPYEDFAMFIRVTLFVDPIGFSNPDRQKIEHQIQRLKKLKKNTSSKLLEIYTEIMALYKRVGPSELKNQFNEKEIAEVFKLNEFEMFVDSFARKFSLRNRPGVPTRRTTLTKDYTVGAVLSLVIKDSRGARWNDIYELLRWFKKNVTLKGRSGLHTTKYNRLTLEDESKYIKKKYKLYVDNVKEHFFPSEKKF